MSAMSYTNWPSARRGCAEVPASLQKLESGVILASACPIGSVRSTAANRCSAAAHDSGRISADARRRDRKRSLGHFNAVLLDHPPWKSIRRCRRFVNGTARSCARSAGALQAGIDPARSCSNRYDKALASWSIFKLRDRARSAYALPVCCDAARQQPLSRQRPCAAGVFRRLSAPEGSLANSETNSHRSRDPAGCLRCWPSRLQDRPADYKKQTFDMLGAGRRSAGKSSGYHLCYGSPRRASGAPRDSGSWSRCSRNRRRHTAR